VFFCRRHFLRHGSRQNESSQKKHRGDPTAASWRHLAAGSRSIVLRQTNCFYKGDSAGHNTCLVTAERPAVLYTCSDPVRY